MEKTELIISIVFALLFLFCIALIVEGEITNYKKNKKK
jgi:hypothetical protein